MSHVTLEQTKKLYSLGFPLCKQSVNGKILYDSLGKIIGYEEKWETHPPSAEELMEWLAGTGELTIETTWKINHWLVTLDKHAFMAKHLIDALYNAACWVLEKRN